MLVSVAKVVMTGYSMYNTPESGGGHSWNVSSSSMTATPGPALVFKRQSLSRASISYTLRGVRRWLFQNSLSNLNISLAKSLTWTVLVDIVVELVP